MFKQPSVKKITLRYSDGFFCNLSATGENFGIIGQAPDKKIKKVKDSQKKVTKTVDITIFNGEV